MKWITEEGDKVEGLKIGNLIEIIPDSDGNKIRSENDTIWFDGYSISLFGKHWASIYPAPEYGADVVATDCEFCLMMPNPRQRVQAIKTFFTSDHDVKNCTGQIIDPTVPCICSVCRANIERHFSDDDLVAEWWFEGAV